MLVPELEPRYYGLYHKAMEVMLRKPSTRNHSSASPDALYFVIYCNFINTAFLRASLTRNKENTNYSKLSRHFQPQTKGP